MGLPARLPCPSRFAPIVASLPVARRPITPPVDLKELERRHILQTLALTDWRIAGPDGAAVRLGIPPSTFHSRMKQCGIKRLLPCCFPERDFFTSQRVI
ncbi:MAG: helix-turn-helix domain-containing protein [Nitrospiraceae bacterium]